MRIIEVSDRAAIQALKERKVDFNRFVREVQPIVDEVREGGDAAIRKFIEKFDKKEITALKVAAEHVKAAHETVSSDLKRALNFAKVNIEKFHAEQLPKEWSREILPGVTAGQIIRPIEKVGCYIPGGRYPLISTVLMTLLPAKVAGVTEIVVCTPTAHPEILYAADLCGAKAVYEVGGPMAIAGMAYGTETIPKVNKIVGPGNLYVSAAKKIVYGDVGIDFIAGPSEVVIVADGSANPEFIAADMLAQAEHDVRSMALCITPSRVLAESILKAIKNRIQQLSTRSTAGAALESQGGIIIVESMEAAINLSNMLSPEHLIISDSSQAWIDQVKNVGSLFLGEYSPEAAGDYVTGPNHVLPTNGFAAVQAGLSVRDFLKTPSIQSLTKEGLKLMAPAIIALAEAEGLDGHAASIKARFSC